MPCCNQIFRKAAITNPSRLRKAASLHSIKPCLRPTSSLPPQRTMSTPVKTYPSLARSVPILSHSLFTHLLTKDGELIGGHAPELPAFTDAPSGTTINRRQLRDFSLALGHGLKNLGAKRGDTVLVFSPNSLNYPVILLGGAP